MGSHCVLLCLLFAGVVSAAFNLSLQDDPPVFADISVTWTRDASDPSDFWFNEIHVDTDGSHSKVLSLQVSDTGSLSGTMAFVFLKTGSHIIQVATNENSLFQNISTSITAVTSGSTVTSCSPASTTTISGSQSSVASSTSVVIGATIGTVVPTCVILSATAIFCLRRRSAKSEGSDSAESGNAAQASSSVFPRLNGARNRTTTVTPFVAPLSAPARTKEGISIPYGDPHAPTPLPSSPTSNSRSTTYAGSTSEKPLLRRDETIISPVVTEGTFGESAQASQSANGDDVPPLTERQRVLEEEASRLRTQIMGMVNQALSASSSEPVARENDVRNENRMMAAEIARMREQIQTLEDDRNSSWARGLSDEPPSYLTSIGR